MVKSSLISVNGTTAVQLHRSESNGCIVHVSLAKNANSIAIGTFGLSFNTSFQLDARTDQSSHLTIPLPPGDSLWSICEAGKTEVVGIMAIEY